MKQWHGFTHVYRQRYHDTCRFPLFVLVFDQIKTGVEGKNVAFLFTDTQIVVETMLEDLNNVLNSGEIPNLFPQDEQVGARLQSSMQDGEILRNHPALPAAHR